MIYEWRFGQYPENLTKKWNRIWGVPRMESIVLKGSKINATWTRGRFATSVFFLKKMWKLRTPCRRHGTDNDKLKYEIRSQWPDWIICNLYCNHPGVYKRLTANYPLEEAESQQSPGKIFYLRWDFAPHLQDSLSLEVFGTPYTLDFVVNLCILIWECSQWQGQDSSKKILYTYYSDALVDLSVYIVYLLYLVNLVYFYLYMYSTVYGKYIWS